MQELDLHGLYHHEVESEVENFVLLNSTKTPFRIITGNSTPMKNITEMILMTHNFSYYIPAHNGGEIIVTHDNDFKF